MTNIQDLRKIYSAQGLKGFSSANRAAFTANIEAGHAEALEIDATLAPVEVAPVATAPKKGTCEDCGRKVGKSGHPTLCETCLDYAGWENTHSDDSHGDDFTGVPTDTDICPVCHPELDGRTAKPTGKSRAGMVIVAKGSEIHKSETFRVAAEAAGWTVTMIRESYGLEADAEGEGTRYYATASRGESHISLAWDGKAYDYPASGASFNGKSRKVRNLKEALRLL